MPRPPVDSRLQNIERGILDINKKLDAKTNPPANCNCELPSLEKKIEKNGESQVDE